MRRTAFTLIELLVVVTIIALLIAILLPALSRARSNARSATCLSSLRQLGVALVSYAHGENDLFPAVHGNNFASPTALPDNTTVRAKEWFVRLASQSMTKSNLLCSEDVRIPEKNPDAYSYIMNDLFAFARATSRVERPTRKIIVSERGDQNVTDLSPAIDMDLFTGLCYHPWGIVETWLPAIKDGRHIQTSNFLFADGHAEPLARAKTIGSDSVNALPTDGNMHYLPEFAK